MGRRERSRSAGSRSVRPVSVSVPGLRRRHRVHLSYHLCDNEPEPPVETAGALGASYLASGLVDRAGGDEEHADAPLDLPTLETGETVRR